MQFRFESNLQFQLDAIRAAVGVFEGAPYLRAQDRIMQGVVGNALSIVPEQVAENVAKVASGNGIGADAIRSDSVWDFSLEMETGTGKTYVYLRTILELHKAYGLTKFMIVVPSIAVREGVLKTLRDTRGHFRDLYRFEPQFFVYDSKKPAAVRAFAQSGALQIMVMNTQAFAGEDRLIHQETDRNGGVPLIELIRDTRPVVIMDEPQEGMGTTNFKERLAQFSPLACFRYSATHRDIVNLIYRLTPVDAYNRRLVKVLEVLSVVERDAQNAAPMTFLDVSTMGGKKPTAKLLLNVRAANGQIVEKEKTIRLEDDLEAKTNNPAYAGWVVSRIHRDISHRLGHVMFTNGVEILEKERLGHDQATIFGAQIRNAVRRHFQKKDKLIPQSIKPLALFFIDRVANYVDGDGMIKTLFEQIYAEEFRTRYGSAPTAVGSVHSGYFAKSGNGEWTDNESSMAKNKDAYDLILRDKERLLDPKEPVEFIFSHSALGVGWDNPNVFTICTLNERTSAIRKRQEIGRGLRICVNAQGERVRDAEDVNEADRVNVLTIVPNASFERFVASYQQEIEEDLGPGSGMPAPRNANVGPDKITIKKEVFESSAFDELWRRIAKKTRYELALDESALIAGCAKELAAIRVPEHRVVAQLDRITALAMTDVTGVRATRGESLGGESVHARANAPEMDLIARLSKESRLAFTTTLAAMRQADCVKEIAKNPVAWLSEAAHRIRRFVNREMVSVIRYAPTGDSYTKDLFKEVIETYEKTVPVTRGVYDKVSRDSDVEERFALGIDDEPRVRLLMKLPGWYRIDTPVGSYNPDWAIVVERNTMDGGKGETHRFIVETKANADLEDLDDDERLKILCARAHFEAIGFTWYLAPVVDKPDFARKATEKVGMDIL